MMKISIDSNISVSEYWKELRVYFLDRILIGFLILASFGMPISLSRALAYGWQSVYAVQLSISIAIFFLYLFRHHFPFSFKLTFLVVSLVILSFMGLASFGLAGGGVLFLVLLQFLVASFYRPRVGLIWFTLTSMLYMAIGIGFISGHLTLRVNFDAYMINVFAWASVWILFSVICIIAFRAMGVMQQALLDLLQEIERQRNEIHHMANHDDLTGLPTMRLAQDRLEMAIRHAEKNNDKVAILFVDLDGFKQINDRFGHECGDYALQETARRMCQVVRMDDTVARRSGDEFLVILECVLDSYYISTIAKRIIEAVSQPMVYKNATFTLGASVGIAIFPDNTRSIEALQQLADEAMYTIKKSHKNDFCFSQIYDD